MRLIALGTAGMITVAGIATVVAYRIYEELGRIDWDMWE